MQSSQTAKTARSDDRRSVVLVVDDEKGPRESLRMILSSRYRVVTASDGERALEILRTQPVDLVTTDLNMPGLKGDQLAGIIRNEFPEIEVIVISGFATVEAAVGGIRNGICDFLTKPFDVVQVTSAVERALARQPGCGVEGVDDEDGDRQLDPQKIEFLELLADTVEARDPETRGHARRVSFYAGLIADSMKLSLTQREHTRIAAFLHDLGKLGLAELETPIDRLPSRIPCDVRVEHATIGENLLRSLGLPTTITAAVRHHHERWDGGGAPDSLQRDQSPLIARIIAVADAFDAMVRDGDESANRRGRAALRELQSGAGTQFDPRVVSALCEVCRVPERDKAPAAEASTAQLCIASSERSLVNPLQNPLQENMEELAS